MAVHIRDIEYLLYLRKREAIDQDENSRSQDAADQEICVEETVSSSHKELDKLPKSKNKGRQA